MIGNRFVKFDPAVNGKSKFEQLLDLFMQLLTYTSGDVNEALQWMNELDKKYQLTDDEYGMGDFIEDLKRNGYIKDDNETGALQITAKSEQSIRKKSLEDIFGKLKIGRGLVGRRRHYARRLSARREHPGQPKQAYMLPELLERDIRCVLFFAAKEQAALLELTSAQQSLVQVGNIAKICLAW